MLCNCAYCGKELQRAPSYINSREKVFCNTDHHAKYQSQQVEKTCPNCGKIFKRPPSRSDTVYCSRKCLMAMTPKVTKTCTVCGKQFTVNQSVADRYTVCSTACRRSETKYVSCERCGKMFRAEKHLNRHYCSEECRRPPVHINCRTCGTQIRIQPNDTDRQFCSFACYRRFNGENQLEKRVRETLDLLNIPYVQEAKLGRYSIDFLLQEQRIALEIDGIYWHRDKARDERKNKYLHNYGWNIVRISEIDIDNALNLDRLIIDRLQSVIGIQITPLQPSLF